jgi:hypothetical protein
MSYKYIILVSVGIPLSILYILALKNSDKIGLFLKAKYPFLYSNERKGEASNAKSDNSPYPNKPMEYPKYKDSPNNTPDSNKYSSFKCRLFNFHKRIIRGSKSEINHKRI